MPNERDELGSRAATTMPSANSKHLKQKRARSQLSCAPCRTGKLKCNRSHEPACDQCIKRSRESSCIYLPPPVKHKPTQNVKGRIRQLESLVVDLMNNTNRSSSDGSKTVRTANERTGEQDTGPFSQPTPPSDGDSSQSATDRGHQNVLTPPDELDNASPLFGQMRISKKEISYVGESHWGAILNSISELKRELSDEEVDDEHDDEDEDMAPESITNTLNGGPFSTPQQHTADGMGFLLGNSAGAMTKEQLIASIPEKKVVDRLLSLWFNSPDPFKPIIHAPTFQDEYRQFWKSPKSTPTMWLGLLFSILSLATSFGLRDCDRSSAQSKSTLAKLRHFHSLAASAAVLADYTKPKEYTLECLVLYASGLRSDNAFVSVWLMIGLVIRLALRMGYHRDPSHYPEISAFRGEMRRRLWAIIHMIDVLISFQLGLPSMVRTIQFDTQPPHNLLDRDFSVNTRILPPGREVHELTPSSYTRAKFRMVHIFANAAELSHATIPPAYEEMMALDEALEIAKAAIPPLLRMPETTELVTDPAEQLMCRFNLDLLYLKTKLTLHRRYQHLPLEQLTPEDQCAGIGTSRKICTEVALRVLSHHHTIYSASQTGGQLESVKWYMGSISTHDFLLAAIIICLELSLQIETGDRSGNIYMCPRRGAMMQALEQSHTIWSEASGRRRGVSGIRTADAHIKGEHMFDETEKASRAMAVMIKKVKAKFGAAAMGGLPKQGNLSQSNVSTTSLSEKLESPPTNYVESRRSHNLVSMPGQSSWESSEQPLPDGERDTSPISSSQTNTTSTNSYLPFDTNNLQVPDQDFTNLEFPMIDQMLDPSLSSLDWEMWDQQIGTGQATTPWAPQTDNSQQAPSNFDYTGSVFTSAMSNRSGLGAAAQNVDAYLDHNLGMTTQIGNNMAGNVDAFSILDTEMGNGNSFAEMGDWGGNLMNNNNSSTQQKNVKIGGNPQIGGGLNMGTSQNTLFDMSGTVYDF